MKIGIIGYRGYIGSALKNSYSREFIELIDVDLANRDDVNLKIKGKNFDVLYHLGAVEVSTDQTIEQIEKERQINASSILYLHEALSKNTKLVFTSSSNVYGNCNTLHPDEHTKERCQSIWSAHKLLAEHYIKCLFDNWVILRLPNVYGIADIIDQDIKVLSRPVINKVLFDTIENKKSTLTLYNNKECLRDFTHIQDIIKALKWIHLTKNEIYVIGSKSQQTIQSVWDIIYTQLDIKSFIFPDIKLSNMEMRSYTCDHKKFTDDTGWVPTIDIQTGIADTIEKYKLLTKIEGKHEIS